MRWWLSVCVGCVAVGACATVCVSGRGGGSCGGIVCVRVRVFAVGVCAGVCGADVRERGAQWVCLRGEVCAATPASACETGRLHVCVRACGCVCCVAVVATWLSWLRTVDGGTRRVAWRAWTTTGGKWLRGLCGVWATAEGGRAPVVCRGRGCCCSRMRWDGAGVGVGGRDVWAAGAVWAACGGRAV